MNFFFWMTLSIWAWFYIKFSWHKQQSFSQAEHNILQNVTQHNESRWLCLSWWNQNNTMRTCYLSHQQEYIFIWKETEFYLNTIYIFSWRWFWNIWHVDQSFVELMIKYWLKNLEKFSAFMSTVLIMILLVVVV